MSVFRETIETLQTVLGGKEEDEGGNEVKNMMNGKKLYYEE